MNKRPKAMGPQLNRLTGGESLRQHWPEYCMEAAALGIFMISAGGFTVLFEWPASLIHQAIANPDLRRAWIGVAMGATATGLIYSPWGRRSGAHMNPAITLTYLRLGKIPGWDAFYYVVFQFLGGLAGVLLTVWTLGEKFTQPPVNYVVTVPGPKGDLAAFAGECVIAFIMMVMIVTVSSGARLARWTGLFAGLLIASYVAVESPLSGFGMNPARTFASAWPSGIWTALWIYLTAAPLGMLMAAQASLFVNGSGAIRCCKLHHASKHRCIFCGECTIPR